MELRRRGRRVRSGPVWISHLPDDLECSAHHPPRVAFAFGRRTGNAVHRNLLRRRARAIVQDLVRGPGIPPGAYLVGGAPEVTELSFSELRAHLERAVRQLSERRR